ncbi:MAG: hypothetical protein ACPGVN_08990 [Alphaproteobacteria bacterium]
MSGGSESLPASVSLPPDAIANPTSSNIQDPENIAAYQVKGNNLQVIREKTDRWKDKANAIPPTYATEAHHSMLWSRFAELIPANARQSLSEFEVFTDGPKGRDAYVGINEVGLDSFKMGIDVYASLPVRDPSGTQFAQTLIHEYAHILTLKPGQIDYDRTQEMSRAFKSRNQSAIKKMIKRCGDRVYFIQGCANPSSYLHAFTKKFWAADLQKWYQSLAFGRLHLSGLFEKNPSAFVSLYAASNPGEDIAESWLAFVTGPEIGQAQTVAQQKVAFFNAYPELVRLRQQIRGVYKQKY